ncbi:nitrate reductase molybdenum cofactor assembly chaperone [Photobacterium sp. SDRW27]|uniref:nitrate reductase molybdenum cofactor assembly chaperone n=1 Tax=Photobacterium obscurum TaxID=2829490 RepID=UPI0022442A93|nr:nitrate reductase molybdenum cofactor assembly chaperone [Photobacterium obscurum]MCW8329091.1 nitrate reductase molybdenum cofactor assembly chaperone [Photobacterium obscurum]
MMNILKVISLLMDYPKPELQQYADALDTEIRQARQIPPEARAQLMTLVDSVCRRDLMQVQEEYGVLFDRGCSLSLLLFEHVHGDSRERGQAMVDLMANYEKSGFDIAVRELPDYIPLYLEYLAHQPDIDARQGLADVGHILGLLSARLHERDSLYASLFDALMIIGGVKVDEAKLKAEVAAEKRDDTFEAMDEVWEAEQVTFMANQSPETTCRPQTAQVQPLRENEQAIPVTWIPENPFSNPLDDNEDTIDRVEG